MVPGRKKILYVDDDERTLNVVSKYLNSNGYEVFVSTSPFIGPILESKGPDLVILDIAMPLLSGDRIADILLNQGYAATTPILFFSGEPEEKIGRAADRYPNAGYVKKESGLEALLEKIRMILA